MSAPAISKANSLDRREFLKLTGGFLLAITLEAGGSRAFAQTPGPTSITTYIRIGADESITVLVGGGEMGQGIYTGLAMATAEELMVPWTAVKVEPIAAISSWLSAGQRRDSLAPAHLPESRRGRARDVASAPRRKPGTSSARFARRRTAPSGTHRRTSR